MPGERLTRDMEHAALGGVLAGIARHEQVDVTLLRVLAVVSIFVTGGVSGLVYIGAWILLPRPDHVAPDASAPPIRDRLRPAFMSGSLREAGDAARRGADRVGEAARMASEAARTASDAARTAADAARTVAEELSDIAHPAAPAGAGDDHNGDTAGAGEERNTASVGGGGTGDEASHAGGGPHV